MPFIKTTSDDDATGLLARIFEAARQRAGKVFNILRIMSPSPKTLQASMGLYTATMFGESELSRSLRELLAVVVSATNECFY
jgi:alkylhydroperoxidase family enzyme